jgi:uncharacterized protein (TIGR02145 family)
MENHMKRISVIILIYFLLTVYLFSQIILQGKVTDNGSEYLGGGAERVENALVALIDQEDQGRIFSDYTDNNGIYTIEIMPSNVDDGSAIHPAGFRLLQNYPNPFNPSTVIGYQLPRPSHIRLEIYDILGRKIKTLLDGFESGGFGQIIWDATNDLNQGVSAGMYIYSMQVGSVRINKKMLLIDGNQGGSSFAISKAVGKDGTIQRVLSRPVSNQYLLIVTGENIETYLQFNLMIIENTVHNIMVYRTVTDIDSNTYRTVKIGNQWWMAENLKVKHYRNGDAIPEVMDATQWANLTTGAYCKYDNNASNVATYGLLYNWYAVGDNRNIAPEGWHVYSPTDLRNLLDLLGGYIVAGGKLKEAGTVHWLSPNTGATNESGFTSLPGGYRRFVDGVFFDIGGAGYWWSTSENNGIILWSESPVLTQLGTTSESGLSVRCVKD